MLVLSRKVGEELLLHEGEIRIRVIRISRHRVAIGIAAPVDVSVRRGELASDRMSEPVSCNSNRKVGDPRVSFVA